MPHPLRRRVATPTTAYKFTGKERDSETGLDYFGSRYNASNMGRFMSPDDFWKDSHPADPQSWNKYAYARNNPLRYVDPTGESATTTTSCSSDANGHQSCTVTVTASIAIYAAPGNNFSQEQMKAFASQMQQGIQKAWSGTGNVNGIDITVQANVTVTVANSKDDAMKSGADNVIGLTAGMAKPGEATSITDTHGMFSGGNRDTGVWSVDQGGGLKAQSAHEFGHLLGGVESNSSKDLMDTNMGQLAWGDKVHATAADYGRVFGYGVQMSQRQYGAPYSQRVLSPTNLQVNINAIWRALTSH